MQFWLGTHETSWLGKTDVPLFISARRLRLRKALPRAVGSWALDSGGFTELSLYGSWVTPAMQYASEVRSWSQRIGGMQWAAIQDLMCEPHILARTGLSVIEHQRQTVASYLLLHQLAPDLPWVPVLQGWTPADYLHHVEDYDRAGVDLTTLPLVGLGSVCRRQATFAVEELVRDLAGLGIRLHAFGLKLGGLRRCGRYLESADSLAWSFDARRSAPLPGCPHASCANCLRWALRWREKALRAAAGSEAAEQRTLFVDPFTVVEWKE